MPGIVTSGIAVTDVSAHGFGVLPENEELPVPIAKFPWFKRATIEQRSEVTRSSEDHLYWPALDVDLSVESLRNPSAFPLVSAAQPFVQTDGIRRLSFGGCRRGRLPQSLCISPMARIK